MVNEPKRGVGPGTVDKIRNFAASQEISLLDASANIMLSPVKGKVAQAVYEFANLILDLRDRLDDYSVTELVELVLKKQVTQQLWQLRQPWKAKLGLKISKNFCL